MKKTLFSAAAAFSTAIGLMSKKAPSKFTTYYWFKSKANYNVGSLPIGVVDSFVTFSSISTSKPITTPCINGYDYICLLGFTAYQVTSAGHHLLNYGFGQTAVTCAFTRY